MGEVFPDIGVLVGLYSLGRNVDCDAAVEGSVTDSSEVHSLKAQSSIRVTPSGMLTDFSDAHW